MARANQNKEEMGVVNGPQSNIHISISHIQNIRTLCFSAFSARSTRSTLPCSSLFTTTTYAHLYV